ncbi:MAG: hypothetical protein GZ088_09595 [Acidipila sp.]|nr:hypothetical protein [Acidipila sp.]
MKCQDEVIRLAETYVKQLEGLEYSKNRDLALKLTGCVDTCIHIGEVGGDNWNTRVQQALKKCMMDRVPLRPISVEIPPELAQHTPPVAPPLAAQQLDAKGYAVAPSATEE